MQRAHMCLRDLHEFQLALSHGLLVSHVFGVGNPGADLASRARFRDLRRLCATLGVASVPLPIPDAVSLFLDRFVAAHVSAHASAS
ncbi:MAG: hypothetical protein AAF098_19915, partial [Pseudomonadota bacterium]